MRHCMNKVGCWNQDSDTIYCADIYIFCISKSESKMLNLMKFEKKTCKFLSYHLFQSMSELVLWLGYMVATCCHVVPVDLWTDCWLLQANDWCASAAKDGVERRPGGGTTVVTATETRSGLFMS